MRQGKDYFNSGQSRFTTVDPIGMGSASIGDPQSLNLFAYVTNNPADFADPSGLDDLPEGCFKDEKGEIQCAVDVPIDQEYDPITDEGNVMFLIQSRELEALPIAPNYGGSLEGDLPDDSYIDEVLKRKAKGKLSCRDFLNTVSEELGSKLTIDQTYESIKENITLVSKLSYNRIGVAYIRKGKRRIDIQRYNGGTPNFDTRSYYTRIILHELLHHTTKGKRDLSSHKKIRQAFEKVKGKGKEKYSTLQYLDRIINEYCTNPSI